MRIHLKTIILCYLLIKGAANGYAQSNTVATGGDAAGINGKVSYSVGQIDYQSIIGTTGTVSQGVQQPYEVTVITGIGITDIDLIISVYPNPAADFVTLSFTDTEVQNMSYGLFDVQGKLIGEQKINKKQTEIPMSGLANGTYFIKVFDNKSEIKKFRIIKNS